jgi:hypothetical protein
MSRIELSLNPSSRALEIAERVEAFVRDVVVPYERDPRRDHHGAPLDELVCANMPAPPGCSPRISWPMVAT